MHTVSYNIPSSLSLWSGNDYQPHFIDGEIEASGG